MNSINDLDVYNNDTKSNNVTVRIVSNKGVGSPNFAKKYSLKGYNESPKPKPEQARAKDSINSLPAGKHKIIVEARGRGERRVATEDLWMSSPGFPTNYRLDVYIHPDGRVTADTAIFSF